MHVIVYKAVPLRPIMYLPTHCRILLPIHDAELVQLYYIIMTVDVDAVQYVLIIY